MNTRYTREWWKERLPLIQAFTEGKHIQVECVVPAADKDWPHLDKVWKDRDTPDFGLPTNSYRIAPEPKLRPWKLEEVPVGALVRYIGDDKRQRGCWLINYVDDGGIPIPAGNQLTWLSLETLHSRHQHSTDGGKTWHPCGVMEE